MGWQSLLCVPPRPLPLSGLAGADELEPPLWVFPWPLPSGGSCPQRMANRGPRSSAPQRAASQPPPLLQRGVRTACTGEGSPARPLSELLGAGKPRLGSLERGSQSELQAGPAFLFWRRARTHVHTASRDSDSGVLAVWVPTEPEVCVRGLLQGRPRPKQGQSLPPAPRRTARPLRARWELSGSCRRVGAKDAFCPRPAC